MRTQDSSPTTNTPKAGEFPSQNGQRKFQEPASKFSSNIKQVNKSGPGEEEIYPKHLQIIKNFLTDSPLDINEYEDVLLKSDDDHKQNLIHRTIRKFNEDRAPPKALDLVDRLVIDDPELFVQPDAYGNIPLISAAQSNVEILFRVISLVISDTVLEHIKRGCDRRHTICPLEDVHKRRLEQCKTRRSAKLDITKHREGEQSVALGASQIEQGSGNVEVVCLNRGIDSDEIVRRNAKLKDILSRTLGPRKSSCLQSLMSEVNFDPNQYKDEPIIPLDKFRRLLQFCPHSVFVSPAENGYNPLQMAIRLYDRSAIDYDHLHWVIKEMIERSPASIYFKASYNAHKDAGKTAYRLLMELKQDKSESVSSSQSRKLTEELLKKVCIGAPQEEQDWHTKMEFLYGDNAKSMRKIGLNLCGELAPLDVSYISRARKKSGMHFETVLDFVKLPYWNPQNRERQHQSFASRQGKGADANEVEVSDPYPGVFQWLWDSGVKKIFTIEVDDIGVDPHTNAAIRQSLRRPIPGEDNSFQDFEVEVWKWKKLDICSETIFDAAPEAREVYLYSSGNTAVLRGWAYSPGLHKLKNLQRLIIEIYPTNANDKEDCERYFPHLKKQLAERCQCLRIGNIVERFPRSRPGQANSSEENGQGNERKRDEKLSNDTPNPQEWINKMAGFKDFLWNMLEEHKRPSVKIALLDDGAKLDRLDGRQKGESFRLDNVEYFIGPCSHGTEMARCIRDICPMAELYIARLDDSRVAENQKFTTNSCYKALKWAVDMEVDIISMSWTFEKKGSDKDPGEKNFRTLIEAIASNKKPILFASLPDKGATAQSTHYAPVGLDGVIRIGSANIFGQQAQENRFEETDFLLPGEEIKTAEGETVSGSSYPTAYASGLAALVLYCLRAHARLEDALAETESALGQQSFDDEDRNKRLTKAETIDGMKTIFKVLSQKNANDVIPKEGLFVRPYQTFGGDFGSSKADTLSYLRKNVPKLLPVD